MSKSYSDLIRLQRKISVAIKESKICDEIFAEYKKMKENFNWFNNQEIISNLASKFYVSKEYVKEIIEAYSKEIK